MRQPFRASVLESWTPSRKVHAEREDAAGPLEETGGTGTPGQEAGHLLLLNLTGAGQQRLTGRGPGFGCGRGGVGHTLSPGKGGLRE